MKITITHLDPTIEAVLDAIRAEHANEQARPYLGMSNIAHECGRYLWLSFRWAHPSTFDVASLLRFEDGHRSEEIMAARLRSVRGIELHTIDPDTGGQIGFSDWGGHFSGHMDGAILGLAAAPKSWHVWESKAVGHENFKKLGDIRQRDMSKDGKSTLAEWSPVYYGQAVLYMSYSGMDRHYLTVASAGSRDMAAIRTDADPARAAVLRERAGKIIKSDAPLSRISEDSTWWQCRGCPAHDVCHGYSMPQVNCRTCTHATPIIEGEGGRWHCAKRDALIDVATQRVGCDQHAYLPTMLQAYGLDPINADGGSIQYMTKSGNTLWNGPDDFARPSTEVANIKPVIIDETLSIMSRLNASPIPDDEPDPPGTFSVSAEAALAAEEHTALVNLSDMARKRLSRGELSMKRNGKTKKLEAIDNKNGRAVK
jgi:hypothetical protein